MTQRLPPQTEIQQTERILTKKEVVTMSLPLKELISYGQTQLENAGIEDAARDARGLYCFLDKLDNVDEAKEQRYRHVYAKLHDFEDYMEQLGINTDLSRETLEPVEQVDLSLRSSAQSVETLKYMAIEHNIRLMHTISREISCSSRSEIS